jgi:hypothetical protein
MTDRELDELTQAVTQYIAEVAEENDLHPTPVRRAVIARLFGWEIFDSATRAEAERTVADLNDAIHQQNAIRSITARGGTIN